jgi:hypothetical protein
VGGSPEPKVHNQRYPLHLAIRDMGNSITRM